MFLLWPLLLACLMVSDYWKNILTLGAYVVLVLLTCVTTATLALFCSTLFRKTSVSLSASYLLVVTLFAAPLAMSSFAETFFPNGRGTKYVQEATFVSPVSAAFSLPLILDRPEVENRIGRPETYISYFI